MLLFTFFVEPDAQPSLFFIKLHFPKNIDAVKGFFILFHRH